MPGMHDVLRWVQDERGLTSYASLIFLNMPSAPGSLFTS